MEFTNFKMLVRDEIAKRAGENYKVRLNDVVKNNGVVLTGLTVMNEDSNISPTIYLNNYYEEYQNGNISLVSIVNDVMDNYNQNRIDKLKIGIKKYGMLIRKMNLLIEKIVKNH